MGSREVRIARSLAPLALVPLIACFSPPVASPRTTVTQEKRVRIGQNLKNKVDVLFMVDNSSSMDPMQLELRQRFGDFFKVFEDLAASGTYADLHIGVVTSDYGAGDSAEPGATSTVGCQVSPGGQKGILQTVPSPNATNPPPNCQAARGRAVHRLRVRRRRPAPPTCRTATTPPRWSPSSPAWRRSAPRAAASSISSSRCTRRCTTPIENKGFLRSDALLTVVFVTNEDDGSAPPSAKFYEAAGSDPSGGGTYGQYTTYRQTRFAVDCGGQPIPYGMPLRPAHGLRRARRTR